MRISEAATRVTPTEVWETKDPWLVRRFELAADSGGAGRYCGGLAVDVELEMLEESYVTSVVEGTKAAPQGREGGLSARANAAVVRDPSGNERPCSKETGLRLPKGWRLEMRTGGGGGFGPPAERDHEAVHPDTSEGNVTEPFARENFPHAFRDAAPETKIASQDASTGLGD